MIANRLFDPAVPEVAGLLAKGKAHYHGVDCDCCGARAWSACKHYGNQCSGSGCCKRCRQRSPPPSPPLPQTPPNVAPERQEPAHVGHVPGDISVEQRLVYLANMVGLPTRFFRAAQPSSSDQFDVFIADGTGTQFRYGYFHGNTFFRENPVVRNLRRAGVKVHEGRDDGCGAVHEPQYDLSVDFDENGDAKFLSDNRTAQVEVRA